MSVIKEITKKTSSGTETRNLGVEASNVTMSDGETVEAAVSSHIGSKSNPHGVTKSQVGLGSVPNVATNDQTPTFSQASSRTNIASGEKLTTIFGKIMKFFADLKAVAFSGSYTDLTNKPTSMTPTSHASSSTTYGAGNVSSYGHLKLSAATNSTSGESGGIAATPSAVKAAYDLADSKAASNHTHTATDVGALPILGGSLSGNLTVNGKLVSGGVEQSADGDNTVVIGGFYNFTTSKNAAVLGGHDNTASGESSVIIGGQRNKVIESDSAAIAGGTNTVSGQRAVALGGCDNNVLGDQVKMGHKAKDGNAAVWYGTQGDAFIIGNGTGENSGSNAARITYAGDIYAAKSINGTGADYAELREWQDGNPDEQDRCGLMVTLAGSKIRLAQPGDDIRRVGVISGNPCVIGNNYADAWHGKYKRDVFGRYIKKLVHHDAVTDDEGNVIYEEADAYDFVLADDFDLAQNDDYMPREERPEFDFMGTHGEIVTIDDGTCEADRYCVPGENGIATKGEDGFYVMERIDENHIKVFVR